MGRKPGSWRPGANLVRRELGKELVLLAWAIEDADPGLIPMALANWNGLVPEERWWLYTQTAAATGHGITDRGRGWRKAVRYALTENPVSGQVSSESVVPEYFRRAAGSLFEHLGVAESGRTGSRVTHEPTHPCHAAPGRRALLHRDAVPRGQDLHGELQGTHGQTEPDPDRPGQVVGPQAVDPGARRAAGAAAARVATTRHATGRSSSSC